MGKIPFCDKDALGREKNCILGTKNTPTNFYIVDVFNVSVLYYEKSIDTFSLCIIHEWVYGVNNFFKIFFTQQN